MATLSPSNARNMEDVGIPHEFICPLTLEIMNNPLMDRSGRSFERAAIVEWITTKNSTCPLTRQPLFVKDLLPNNKLRNEIMQWREEQGEDFTLDASQDKNVIRVEELNRMIRVWEENNFKCANPTTYDPRNIRGRRHRRYLSSGTTCRFMRIFYREQQGI